MKTTTKLKFIAAFVLLYSLFFVAVIMWSLTILDIYAK